MTFKFITLITKTFLRLKLHYGIKPFENFLENMVYLSKFSGWAHENKNIPFNDFPTKTEYAKRTNLYDHLYSTIVKDEPVTYLEFGVAKGDSIKWWLTHNRNMSSRFYGFDTFQGLPEAWGRFQKGHFDTGLTIPETNDTRATFVPGLFQQSLPDFLRSFDRANTRLIIHCDADLYTSTLFSLASISPFLRNGDLILFDEFNIPIDEFRAFLNFTSAYYMSMQLIGAASNYTFVAFEVTGAPTATYAATTNVTSPAKEKTSLEHRSN